MLQVIDDGDRLQTACRRIKALDQARGEIVAVEVVLKTLLDIRPQNFYGDGFFHAVFENVSLVHLRDRCGGDGRTKLNEMIFELAAKRALDGDARFGHRERFGLVLQMAQVG